MYEDDFLEMAYEDSNSFVDTTEYDGEEDIVNPSGYLNCGCHGSQREHTCNDTLWDERDYDV